MCKRWLGVALAMSLAGVAAAETPADTEARNAAAGFAITTSLTLLEGLQTDGWGVTHSRWSIGDGPAARAVAVYELTPS